MPLEPSMEAPLASRNYGTDTLRAVAVFPHDKVGTGKHRDWGRGKQDFVPGSLEQDGDVNHGLAGCAGAILGTKNAEPRRP